LLGRGRWCGDGGDWLVHFFDGLVMAGGFEGDGDGGGGAVFPVPAVVAGEGGGEGSGFGLGGSFFVDVVVCFFGVAVEVVEGLAGVC